MSTAPLLELSGLRVAFGTQKVLAEVNLSVAERGLTVLLGPGGAGKSTLLRTLAGLNSAQPSLVMGGTVRFAGGELDRHGAGPQIGYVMQKARFLMASVRENLAAALVGRHALDRAEQLRRITALLERNGLAELVGALEREVVSLPIGLQRRLAVARAVASEPRLLLVDEPTAGLSEVESAPILELLRQHAGERAVMVVTHNQRHARLLGGTVALLADGQVLEVSPTAAFFAAPWTAAGRRFLQTGGYCPPAEDELDAVAPREVRSARPATAGGSVPSFFGPRGFYWVREGSLGGLPRPGIVASLEEDLLGLARLGVTRLITLEETPTVPEEALAQHGIVSVHVPIPDMGVPSVEVALTLCAEVERALVAGEVVAFHCRAGLGRTGTLLACQLIFEGETAIAALEQVRQINPRCIQSEQQARFLGELEQARVRAGAHPITTAPLLGR